MCNSHDVLHNHGTASVSSASLSMMSASGVQDQDVAGNTSCKRNQKSVPSCSEQTTVDSKHST